MSRRHGHGVRRTFFLFYFLALGTELRSFVFAKSAAWTLDMVLILQNLSEIICCLCPPQSRQSLLLTIPLPILPLLPFSLPPLLPYFHISLQPSSPTGNLQGLCIRSSLTTQHYIHLGSSRGAQGVGGQSIAAWIIHMHGVWSKCE